MIGPLLAPIGTAVMVLVFATVMLVKREDLRNRLLRLIGQTQLNLATRAFDDATQRVSRYLRLQFGVNIAFGALITGGLYFIGLPNALLWGILAGAFRFVPYVGPLIGGGMPMLLALAIFPGWVQPLLCLSLFVVIEPLVAYVVEPALYGTHTGISSLAILVAAVVWTALWGPIGLVLSTPLTVCLVVIGRHVPPLGFLHVILGDEPVLPRSAQLYQRLLAADQDEARAVIDVALKESSVIELYDDSAHSGAEHGGTRPAPRRFGRTARGSSCCIAWKNSWPNWRSIRRPGKRPRIPPKHPFQRSGRTCAWCAYRAAIRPMKSPRRCWPKYWIRPVRLPFVSPC